MLSFASLFGPRPLLSNFPEPGTTSVSIYGARLLSLNPCSELDQSVYQSGTFRASKNKISKHGSTYLRKALYQATYAGIYRRFSGNTNALLRAYYDKKISEGKPSKVAIIATSNELLRIIYGILKSCKPFD